MGLSSAFTLIEVLVVVSIIALLISILLPSLKKAKDISKQTVCNSNIGQLMRGIHTYTMDWKGHLPNSNAVTNAALTWTIFQDDNKYYGYIHLGLLYKCRQIPDGKAFFCPSNVEYPHVYPRGWLEYVSPNGAEHRATGYMYAIGGQIDRYKKGARISPRLDDLARPREALVSCMFLANVDKMQRKGLWPHQGGINAGFSDASAYYVNTGPDLARQAADVADKNIDYRDYFSYCVFKYLAGDKRWVKEFPKLPAGIVR